MSDYHYDEAQGLEFARNWRAAREKGARDAEANSKHGVTVVELPPFEVGELGFAHDSRFQTDVPNEVAVSEARELGFSHGSNLHTDVPTKVAVSKASEEEDEPVIFAGGRDDNPNDRDYVPSEDDDDSGPKASISKTRALATKRQGRRSNVPAENYEEAGPEASKATKRKDRRNNIPDEEEEESGRTKASNTMTEASATKRKDRRDRIPSEEDQEETHPKTFDAMKLASAKRKERPFAPSERPAKKKSEPSSSKLVERRSKAHPAAWYTDAAAPKKYTREQLQDLLYLRTLVDKVKQEAKMRFPDMANLLSQLRIRLAEISLRDNVFAALVQKSKLLEEGGLPDIIDKKGFNFPEDLCADATAQYRKWTVGDFDSDLFRGIEYKQNTSANGRVRTSRNLEAGYKFKVSPDYVGEGNLTNGQWWPLQICLLRDGAHGAIDGGISGEIGGVAHSVIVSNSGYANIDKGNQVEYCGTSGHKKEPTAATKMLLEAVRRQSAVRVIRAWAAKTTTYLPRKGLRYDGLYDVTKHVLLDADTAMYRFTLVRQQGQGAIRHLGQSARPNAQELETYGRLRQQFGLPA